MSVNIYKTGIISSSGQSSTLSYYLVNENGDDLVDQNGNILFSPQPLDPYDEYSHGFVEGQPMMSIYDGLIMANEFIEW